MPSKEFVTETGDKKYIELIRFPEKIKERFRKQVMEAVDKYLASNPEMKVEDLIKEAEELPF